MEIYDNGYEIEQGESNGNLIDEQWEKLGAWFVGHVSENSEEFCDLALKTIRRNIRPKAYFPDDKPVITPAMKESNTYRNEMDNMEKELENFNCRLEESIPFSSVRYQVRSVN